MNSAPEAELRTRLRSCCAAEAWVQRIMAGRPYRSEAALYACSDHATGALDADGLGLTPDFAALQARENISDIRVNKF